MARIDESGAVSNRCDSKVFDRCIVVRNKFQGITTVAISR